MPTIIPKIAHSQHPVVFFDVEFSPYMLTSTIRNATSVALFFLDAPPHTVWLIDETGENVFQQYFQDFLNTTITMVGWNPVNDLQTLTKLGYVVPNFSYLDRMTPYSERCGLTGPSLKKAAATFGVPYFGAHATGEVATMALLYRAAPPSCSESEHLSDNPNNGVSH